MTRLVIIGSGQMAEIFCSRFTHSTDYEVTGFAVDKSFIKESELLGRPVVPFEEIDRHFPAPDFHAFVAIGPVQNNWIRAARFLKLQGKGYRFANYISPRAEISPDATLGENVSIGDFCVISPFARIGDNVLIGPASLISHHCHVQAHAFLSLHVVMAGSVVVGERAFVGIGAVIRDNMSLGEGCIIGAGATICSDVESNSVYASPAAKPSARRADQTRL